MKWLWLTTVTSCSMSQSTPRLIPARPVELKKITWIEAKSFHKAAHHATFKWLLKFQKKWRIWIASRWFQLLWRHLKQAVHVGKNSNVVEFKQFCKAGLAKIAPQWCEILISSYCKHLNAGLAAKICITVY